MYRSMSDYNPPSLFEILAAVGKEMTRLRPQAFRVENRRRSRRGGATLRPGRETPLWNALRAELRPHLKHYGSQARLGRLLGLPRQQVNAFVTGGGRMPDAERALQLIAWLLAVRQGRPPG